MKWTSTGWVCFTNSDHFLYKAQNLTCSTSVTNITNICCRCGQIMSIHRSRTYLHRVVTWRRRPRTTCQCLFWDEKGSPVDHVHGYWPACALPALLSCVTAHRLTMPRARDREVLKRMRWRKCNNGVNLVEWESTVACLLHLQTCRSFRCVFARRCSKTCV